MKKPDLGEKDALNPSEAAEYWNLSRRAFFRFLKTKEAINSDFIAFYRTRVLVIRAAFEEYLKTHPDLGKELANGKSNKEIHEERLKAKDAQEG